MSPRVREIPPDVRGLLVAGGGLFTAAAASAAGIPHNRLMRLIDANLLHRVAHGVFVEQTAFLALGPWARHRMQALGFGLSCGPDVYLTGWSAIAVWGLPTSGRPPALPVATRAVDARRLSGSRPSVYGQVGISRVAPEHQRRLGETRLVSRAWAVADAARSSPLPHALVSADAVARLHAETRSSSRHGSVSEAELVGSSLPHAAAAMNQWTGAERARWVARHADACAETPIETWGRYVCHEYALPMPIANAWVGGDEPRWRVDGLWPWHWAAFEADGAVKYNNRSDAAKVVAEQHQREWRLRRLGLDIVRYGWDEGTRYRAGLAHRFDALLDANPARDAPVRWWKHVPGVGPVEPSADDWPSPTPTGIVLPRFRRRRG